jgi:predicted metal-dependent phosphoesterase TrpH
MDRFIDLHVHTTASDGAFTPAQVVKLAQTMGLAAIAITDHDTVAGNAEAYAEGLRDDVEVIPGVEISCDFTPTNIHMVGIFIDPTSPALSDALADVREHRQRRNPKILARLAELGMSIDLAEVTARARGETVGRPHIAEVMVAKDYVADTAEAFDRFLANGKPAYVARRRIAAEEGIQLIHAAGGLAFIAHPGLLALPPRVLEGMIFKLARAGLDGLEVYYTDHLPTDTAFMRRIADEFDLLQTGGSDFHGPAKPGVDLGRGRGDLRIPYDLVVHMKARLNGRAKVNAAK